MWSQPFIRKVHGQDSDVAVLLMDTQGMFDNETTMTLTAQIFGLSTLVSSYQIYNVDKRIQEDNLQHLALFSEYGRMALDDSDLDPEQAEENSQEKKASSKPKPFQRLDFLVRDWQNFEEEFDLNPDKEESSENFSKLRKDMEAYLEKVLGVRAASDLQSTREQISRCFEHVNCYLMPHPGNAVTKLAYKGEVDKIDPFFRGLLNRYVRTIFDESIQPKTVNGRDLTGYELGTFFRVYVELFTDGEKGFPKAMTMLEATSGANNRNAFDLALRGYKEAMAAHIGTDKRYIKDKLLQKIHSEEKDVCLGTFDSIATMGAADAIGSIRSTLLEEVTTEFERLKEVNAARNPFRDAELYVLPIIVAAVAWLVSVLVDKTCSSDLCERTEDAFERLYLFILFGLVVAAWKYIRGAYLHVKAILPVLLGSVNSPVADPEEDYRSTTTPRSKRKAA